MTITMPTMAQPLSEARMNGIPRARRQRLRLPSIYGLAILFALAAILLVANGWPIRLGAILLFLAGPAIVAWNLFPNARSIASEPRRSEGWQPSGMAARLTRLEQRQRDDFNRLTVETERLNRSIERVERVIRESPAGVEGRQRSS